MESMGRAFRSWLLGGGGGLASRRVPNFGLVGALGSAIWSHLESAVQGFSVNEVFGDSGSLKGFFKY